MPEHQAVGLEAKSPFELRVNLGDDVPEQSVREALATGDLPGVSMVIVDGVPLIGRSRNTAPAGRMAEVVTGPAVGAGGH